MKKNLLEKDPILSEIVQRLARELHPKKIILFGSRARGESAQRVRLVALKRGLVPVDVIVVAKKEFEERKAGVGSLSETAVHESMDLYAAA